MSIQSNHSKKLFGHINIKLMGALLFAATLVAQPFGGAVEALQVINYTDKPFTSDEVAVNWNKDRTLPSGGYGSVDGFMGRDDVLEMNVDKNNPTPLSDWYNTEGLQRQIPLSDSIKADVYVDEDWTSKTVRAGLWGVGYDSSNAISAYPIIEYTTDGFTGWRFYNSNNGLWTNIGPANSGWNTLTITIDDDNNEIDYAVNGAAVGSYEYNDTVGFKATILNNKNYVTDSYQVRWSSFAYGNYGFVAETPTNAKFSNPTVCGGSTNQINTVASWSPVTDATSYTYRAWRDGHATYNSLSNAYTVSVNGTSRPGQFNIGEGTYYFAVQAVYADGQKSDWSTPCAATYDTGAPTTPTITTPVERQWFKATPIKATWTAASDSLSSIKNYQVAYRYDDGHTFGGSTCAGETINGLTLSGCRDTTGTSRNHTPSLNEQGGVSIWVRAIDKAGNKGDWSKPVHYYYDHQAPTGDITYPANGETVVAADGKISVNGSVNDNLSMNRVGVQLVKPGVSGHIAYLYDHMVNTNPGTWEVEFNAAALDLANGTYGLNLYFTDMAGNTSVKKTTFTLDNPVPVVNTEDFGVGSWTMADHGFTGYNVGFNVHDFETVTDVTVELYDEDGLVDTNTGSSALLSMVNSGNIGPSLSTAFATQGEIDDTWCDGSSCWDFGGREWTHASKIPTRTVITVEGTDIYGKPVAKTVENTNFSEAAGEYDSILPPAQRMTIPDAPAGDNGLQLGVTNNVPLQNTVTRTPRVLVNPNFVAIIDDSANEQVLGEETTTPAVLAANDTSDTNTSSSTDESEPAEEESSRGWLWRAVTGTAAAGAAWWMLAAYRRRNQ